jgi:hypothetical protein
MGIFGSILGLGASIYGGITAHKQMRDAQERAAVAEGQRDVLKQQYAGIDTSNPYLNMENVMEDLTVDQRAAQMQQQQFQQSQANILDQLGGAAGSSGIAATAQALSQQGQLAAQQSAASIGQQERANQMARQQEAGRIQGMERQGELLSREQQREQTGTLLGMEQAELQAQREREAQAQQMKFEAIGQGVQSIGGLF